MKQSGKPLDGSKVDVFFLVSVVSCDRFVSLRLSFVSRFVLVVPFFLLFLLCLYMFSSLFVVLLVILSCFLSSLVLVLLVMTPSREGTEHTILVRQKNGVPAEMVQPIQAGPQFQLQAGIPVPLSLVWNPWR